MDESKLILRFLSETGATEELIIRNVKPSITETQINDITNEIISKNVFAGKSGDFKTLESAEIQTTTTIKII